MALEVGRKKVKDAVFLTTDDDQIILEQHFHVVLDGFVVYPEFLSQLIDVIRSVMEKLDDLDAIISAPTPCQQVPEQQAKFGVDA